MLISRQLLSYQPCRLADLFFIPTLGLPGADQVITHPARDDMKVEVEDALETTGLVGLQDTSAALTALATFMVVLAVARRASSSTEMLLGYHQSVALGSRVYIHEG